MTGQDLTGSIRTMGSRDDNNCIILGSVDGVEIRMDVDELNKVITLLQFSLEKKRVHTYATLDEKCVDAIYKAVDEYGGEA